MYSTGNRRAQAGIPKRFKSEKRARVNFKHDVQRATGLETMKENKGSLARPKGMNGFPCAAVSGGEIMQRCKMVVLPGSPKKPYATLKVVAGTGIEVADIDLWALDGVQRGTEKSKGGFKSLTRKQKRQLQRFEANATLGDVDFASAVENAAVKKLLIGAALKIQMAMRLKKARKTIAERRRAKQEQEEERRLGAATGEAPPLQ